MSMPTAQAPMSGRFSNRIVGHGEEAPDQLQANPNNWRIHSAEQQRVMTDVLDDVGWIQSVIVNQVTGTMIDGHMRVLLALKHDEPTVPVTYVRLTPDEEAIVLATFDPIGTMATHDQDQMLNLLDSIESFDHGSDLALLLESQRQLAMNGLTKDHGAAIIAGEGPGRDSEEMLNDYLTTSVRQITLIFNKDDYVEALTILQAYMAAHGTKTNAESVLALLRTWRDGDCGA